MIECRLRGVTIGHFQEKGYFFWKDMSFSGGLVYAVKSERYMSTSKSWWGYIFGLKRKPWWVFGKHFCSMLQFGTGNGVGVGVHWLYCFKLSYEAGIILMNPNFINCIFFQKILPFAQIQSVDDGFLSKWTCFIACMLIDISVCLLYTDSN